MQSGDVACLVRIRQVRLPWAEACARFTSLVERLALDVPRGDGHPGRHQILRISWDEAWHILERAVERGQRAKRPRVTPHLGVDEKAIAKGHQYLTLVCDLDRATVEFIAEDRKQASLAGYFTSLTGDQLAGIEAIALDMWESYRQAIRAHVPAAESTSVFDRYHIMTHMGKAVDDVRKREHRTLRVTGDDTLRGSKYLWLYAAEHLPEQHHKRFAQLKATALKTGRAWAIKESLRELWHYTRVGWAERHWKRWYFWATHSRLPPVIETARLIQRHRPNVMTFFARRITNAVSEGLNSKIQTIKKMAYGFRNREHFKTAIYFHCDGLDLYVFGRKGRPVRTALTPGDRPRDGGQVTMAGVYGFDTDMAAQGAAFALNAPARKDRVQSFEGWKAEVRKGVAYLCVRRGPPDQTKPLETVAMAAHAIAEDFLDIVAVEDRTPLLVTEPHDNVVWRTGPHGLKIQLTTSIVFAAEQGDVRLIVKDAAGNLVPDPSYVPPAHHPAYRYFRYSQAAQNVFDTYRNMFLALESVLDHVAPKQHGEGETDWLRRAMTDAVQKNAADLGPFGKTAGKAAVEGFIDAHYSAVRCAVFHAKAAGGVTLRPGSLSDHDLVLHQLLAVQKVVEHLLKSLFSVRLPQGGFFHSGFGLVLSAVAPAMHLLFGPAECPTAEQLLAEEKNLPQGRIGPVRFEDARPGYTDEWLFISAIKPAELDFMRITSLRLIAYLGHSKLGAMGMLVIPVAEKMNRTLLTTDLDLTGASNLVVRLRCVRSPRRGFAS